MHCEKNKATIYSITQWNQYCINFQKLIKLNLIKTNKNKKLFDLWRKYLLKTKRLFFTERLKEKLQTVDYHLRKGLIEIRGIFSDMNRIKLFSNVNKVNYVLTILLKML